MRRLIVAFLFLVALAAVPATASAAAGAPPDVEPPLFQVKDLTSIPLGFRINPEQAIAIAKTAPRLKAIHRTHHPLRLLVDVWLENHYEIYFYYHDRVIADQIIGRDGQLGATYTGPLILGLYARGHYGGIFDSPWVLGPFTAMFVAPLLLLRRRSWLDRLDLGVVLSFFGSYVLLDHSHVEPAVWLVYPPLVYLLVRMLIRGARSRPFAGRLDCRLPIAALAVGLLALIAGRIFISLHAVGVVDVGTASVLGAYKILHGQSIYYFSIGHGDTYGPLNYLAYVPFEAIWPGSWGYLPAARAAAITFDLLTIAGLIALGIRMRPRGEGWRLGLLLAWLWAACPFTLLGVEKNTNDGLIALVMVLILLSLTSPIKRGILVGVGAAAKWFPAILLPLVAVGQGERDQQTIRKVLAGFVITVGVSIAVFLPSGGLHELWDHTLGYQLSRTDIFSLWAMDSALAPIKVALEAFAVILAVIVAFRPRGARTLSQVAALAAAVIIAVQLPALHWFYLYIPWFLPLVLVAVLAPGAPEIAEPAPVEAAIELDATDDESGVLAGAA
jgi:Glycosyltransferase family 87